MAPWDLQTLKEIIYFYFSPLQLNTQFLLQQLKIISIPHPEALICNSHQKKEEEDFIVFL